MARRGGSAAGCLCVPHPGSVAHRLDLAVLHDLHYPPKAVGIEQFDGLMQRAGVATVGGFHWAAAGQRLAFDLELADVDVPVAGEAQAHELELRQRRARRRRPAQRLAFDLELADVDVPVAGEAPAHELAVLHAEGLVVALILLVGLPDPGLAGDEPPSNAPVIN